jgi:nucleoside phosphorylase
MIVVLTALQLEYTAIRKYLVGIQTHRHAAGTRFETGRVAGRHVAVAVIGEGNMSAATLTERAINEFRPRAVLFVGIAGALVDWLRLGDVVVGTRTYGYHSGRSTDTAFRTRPRVWPSSHELEQVARSVDVTDTWWSTLVTRPHVYFAPIAAGEILLDSRTSPVAAHLRDRYDDAVAIEMESAGMASAGQLNNALTLTIRGISDFAAGAKSRTGRPQPAAEHAAAFAAAVIAQLDDTDPPRAGRPEPDSGIAVHNEANNSNDVIQIGFVQGNVEFGSKSTSLRDGEGGS